MGDDKRQEIKMVFDKFDTNDDGSIDAKELGDVWRAMGGNPTDYEIKEFIKEADSSVNPNGKLEFNEFYNLIVTHLKSQDEEQDSLRQAFKTFDRNGDGKIDKKELRAALTKLGLSKLSEGEVDELFSQADQDDNGFIDYHELVSVLTNCRN